MASLAGVQMAGRKRCCGRPPCATRVEMPCTCRAAPPQCGSQPSELNLRTSPLQISASHDTAPAKSSLEPSQRRRRRGIPDRRSRDITQLLCSGDHRPHRLSRSRRHIPLRLAAGSSSRGGAQHCAAAAAAAAAARRTHPTWQPRSTGGWQVAWGWRWCGALRLGVGGVAGGGAGAPRAGGGWLPRGRAVGGGGGGVGALSPLRRSHRSGTSYSSERRSSPSSLSTLPSPETRGSDSLGAWTHAALELTRGHNSAALGGPEAFEASPARLADHRAQSPVYTSYRIAGGVYCDGESATGTPPSTPGLPAMGDWSTWRGAVSAWRLRPATADNSGVSLARGLRGTGLRVTGRPSSSKLYTLGFQPTLAQIQRPLY
jgi:hypothetical protein